MTTDYQSTIDCVLKKLKENEEWKERYQSYAEELSDERVGYIKKANGSFSVKTPLTKNLTVSLIKNGSKNTVTYSLRYQGQEIGTIRVTGGEEVKLSTNSPGGKELVENNQRDFGYKGEALSDEPWLSPKAIAFRRHFITGKPQRTDAAKKGNKEHNLESCLISEFSKTSSADKSLTDIQPVRFAKTRFAMPTPISASDSNNIRYSGANGGGVDILARTGRGGANYLTVIEVKDEYTTQEPPQSALKQAIAYAVFIHKLLRSESGKHWHELFGYGRDIPSKLKIRACVAMPNNQRGSDDESFGNLVLPVGDDGDTIECHYIYFNWDGKRISKLTTSLPSN